MHIAPPLTHRGSSPARRVRRLRFQRWWLLPLALLIAAGLGFWWYQSRTTTTTTTSTSTVSQGDLAVTVSGSGTVAAVRTAVQPIPGHQTRAGVEPLAGVERQG